MMGRTMATARPRAAGPLTSPCPALSDLDVRTRLSERFTLVLAAAGSATRQEDVRQEDAGAFPIVIGGDQSIGFPDTRAIAKHVEGNLESSTATGILTPPKR